MLIGLWALAIGGGALAQPDKSAIVLPRPVAIWAASPIDVMIAFDRQVDPALIDQFRDGKFGYGKIGYSIPGVQQDGTPAIRIAGFKLEDEGRTLHLATEPHTVAANYRLPPGPGDSWSYQLTGVEASWVQEAAEPDASPDWLGWLPAIDPSECQKSTRGSAPHERGFALLSRAGHLTLAAQATFPNARVRVEVTSSHPIEEILLGNEAFQAEEGGEPVKSHELAIDSTGAPQFLSIRIRTIPEGPLPKVGMRYRPESSSRFGVLPRERLLLSWVPVAANPSPGQVPDLKGGDARRGEAIFFGEQAQCSRCHRVRGKGGEVGPDLSTIRRVGAAEIYRSIATPSARIEPRYVGFTIASKDGRIAAGIIHTDGPDAIVVSDTAAKVTRFTRKEIEQIRPSSASIMPVGLASALGDEKVRDLIAYLMASESGR